LPSTNRRSSHALPPAQSHLNLLAIGLYRDDGGEAAFGEIDRVNPLVRLFEMLSKSEGSLGARSGSNKPKSADKRDESKLLRLLLAIAALPGLAGGSVLVSQASAPVGMADKVLTDNVLAGDAPNVVIPTRLNPPRVRKEARDAPKLRRPQRSLP
jgi:hypothetical protein